MDFLLILQTPAKTGIHSKKPGTSSLFVVGLLLWAHSSDLLP